MKSKSAFFGMPRIQGLIDRRILINYRVAPEVVKKILPAPFEPLVFNGFTIVGICLIRLRNIRPSGWPEFLGYSLSLIHI